MDNLDAARLCSDIRMVQEEMRAAILRFNAHSDEELAQLNLGWWGTVESPSVVHEAAARWREFETKVIQQRLAELDNWIEIIGSGVINEPTIAVMDWFLTAWDAQKRAITKLCYCGCPSITPPHIERAKT